MGVLADGSDYLTSAASVRAAEDEAGYDNPNGVCMLGLADWLKARVALIVATVQTILRALANAGEMSYATPDGARQQPLAHLDVYRRWAETHPSIVLVEKARDLEYVLASWATSTPRIGFVLLMENAEPVREPGELDFWVDRASNVVAAKLDPHSARGTNPMHFFQKWGVAFLALQKRIESHLQEEL